MSIKALQIAGNGLRKTWHSHGFWGVAAKAWSFFWMQFAGLAFVGRLTTWIATWSAPPHYGRCDLSRYHAKGFISPRAILHHPLLRLGRYIFIGDRVVIYQDANGGAVEIEERVYLLGDTYIQTGHGGSLKIGANTCIQPCCHFSAYQASIYIGRDVQIAPNCAFYPFNHGMEPDKPINRQPLESKGNIIIEDGAWLGFGAIVLDGVRIGKGAVIGAGAVITSDIPDGAVAAGVPAKVVKMRG